MANEMKESKKVKHGKKAFYKRWWFKAFIIILVLSAITGNHDGEASEAPETAPPVEVIEITEPMATETEKEAEVTEEKENETQEFINESYDIDDATTLLRIAMMDNFENCEITNDGEVITANVWVDGLALEMGINEINENESYKESWDVMVGNITELSISSQDLVESIGVQNVPVIINVLNDINKNLTLLTVTNGVVIYDWVNAN